MKVSIPDDLWKFVEAQVIEEGHASPGDYLRSLLQDARKRKAMRNLVAELDEALASGPAEPMTREDWDAMEREAMEGLRGESINP